MPLADGPGDAPTLLELSDQAPPPSTKQADPAGVFELWATHYNKKYAGNDRAHRLEVFTQNAAAIAAHNAQQASFTMAINQFADL